MPEHFDRFFDSSCPIPATLAPLASHCLLNQFKMPSLELTFKALQYSVYNFHFLYSLNFSASIPPGSLTLVTCSDFVHTFIMIAYVTFSTLKSWAHSAVYSVLHVFCVVALLLEAILSTPAYNFGVNFSFLVIHCKYIHCCSGMQLLFKISIFFPVKL